MNFTVDEKLIDLVVVTGLYFDSINKYQFSSSLNFYPLNIILGNLFYFKIKD